MLRVALGLMVAGCHGGVAVPPPDLRGPIVTVVEWTSEKRVAERCAEVLVSLGRPAEPAAACTYTWGGGQPVVLVLPYALHPLVVHELGHAHQIARGLRVDHKGWEGGVQPSPHPE